MRPCCRAHIPDRHAPEASVEPVSMSSMQGNKQLLPKMEPGFPATAPSAVPDHGSQHSSQCRSQPRFHSSQPWFWPQFTSLASQDISSSRTCRLFAMKSFALQKLASQSHLQQTIQEPNTTHLWSTQAASSHSALWQLAGRREVPCWTRPWLNQGLFSWAVWRGSGSSLFLFSSNVGPR